LLPSSTLRVNGQKTMVVVMMVLMVIMKNYM